MVQFSKPEMKIIRFEKDDVISSSACTDYNCPGAYGGYCEGGHQYCEGQTQDPCECDMMLN